MKEKRSDDKNDDVECNAEIPAIDSFEKNSSVVQNSNGNEFARSQSTRVSDDHNRFMAGSVVVTQSEVTAGTGTKLPSKVRKSGFWKGYLPLVERQSMP